MTDKEKIIVLNELINKYAISPNPHEHDMVFNVLKEIKNDIASKEEPVSGDLEEVAYRYAIKCEPLKYEYGGYTSPNPEVVLAVKYGADWQKQRLMKNSIEREVKIDAGGYPYIDCNIELYDYLEDVPLAKKGDKVKLIVIQDEQE